MKDLSLGKILLDKSLIGEEDLIKALKIQEKEKLRLGEILEKYGFVKEEDILKALSEKLTYPIMMLIL